MTIIAVHTPTPQGRAALERAALECLIRGEDLAVVNGDPSHDQLDLQSLRDELGPQTQALESAGLAIEVAASRIHDAGDAVIQVAQQLEAALIVLGLRRRTPVGKLLLGSVAQRILLDAECPVLAVKDARD